MTKTQGEAQEGGCPKEFPFYPRCDSHCQLLEGHPGPCELIAVHENGSIRLQWYRHLGDCLTIRMAQDFYRSEAHE